MVADATQICRQGRELELQADKQVQAGMYDDAARLLKEARRHVPVSQTCSNNEITLSMQRSEQ